jgi:uncharacterized protein
MRAMPEDAGNEMKVRLRADLRAAMKERRAAEAKLIRALLAAIDNAEALPARAGPVSLDRHDFRSGSAEVQRRLLDGARVTEILAVEIRERERAIAELESLGVKERAEALRAEILLARRYLK